MSGEIFNAFLCLFSVLRINVDCIRMLINLLAALILAKILVNKLGECKRWTLLSHDVTFSNL